MRGGASPRGWPGGASIGARSCSSPCRSSSCGCVLQPFFPIEHDWGDFVYYGGFFVLGYLVFADERFTRAIRRDWWILLAVGLAATAGFGAIAMSIDGLDLEKAAQTVPEFLLWALFAVAGWCGTTFMLFIGMRFLDRNEPGAARTASKSCCHSSCCTSR